MWVPPSVLTKLLNVLFGSLLGWLRARRERAATFERLKRNVEYCEITNNLPVELHKLREFFIQHDLVKKPGFKGFFERWLSQSFVAGGQPSLVPGRFSGERIAELCQELSALRL